MISVPDFQSAAKEFRAGKIDIQVFTKLVFADRNHGVVEGGMETVPKSGRDTGRRKTNVEKEDRKETASDCVPNLSSAPVKGELELPGNGLTLDEQRIHRCGFSEVIYGEGKTNSQIQKAARKLLSKNQDVLVTRLDPEMGQQIAYHFPSAVYQPLSGTLRISAVGITAPAEEVGDFRNDVAVVCAGTSDQNVAVEARETLAWMGIGCQIIMDVGVAGPDRLIPHLETLKSCKVVIVVAGMDGALASVVGGHLSCPVLSVPTSVGYGACFGGVAPLLSMLNSCASNVLPVNIDSGFKAAYFAGVMLNTFSHSNPN